ncbi:hypothetical protein SAMN05421770_11251 [Granulicella rosea]|uniref:Outer membrane protein beta-barrel domain-containing protein n=1 Tax=Granulicella rosea TaxID=474952 RepID=A0A239MHS4_9BACT|nr:hypothetical protein [Granulicella rosea]SNT41654.1 hypothetical protein SAMN05421770_11251 [Granulicella rosea]
MHLPRPALLLATLAVAVTASAQRQPKLDLSLGYVAEHANPVGQGGNFWTQGGFVEIGADAWRGLGLAANVTGTHTNSFGPNAVPLTLVTATFGPRYRYAWPAQRHPLSVFGEALVGEAHGIGSLFPATQGVNANAVSLALQLGGGVDLGLSRHLAVRAVQAGWVRTQLPNSTTNVQNDLRIGAGLAVKF